jgi:hypothetical protein
MLMFVTTHRAAMVLILKRCTTNSIGFSELAQIAVIAALMIVPGWVTVAQADSESEAPVTEPSKPIVYFHMSEELRASVEKLVVIAGTDPANKDITGTYDDITPGFLGGVSEGANAGTYSTQVGGISIGVPIPILMIPSAVYGGISGHTKRELQEFRDALTEDLAEANQALVNDRLATDVYQALQRVPGLDSKIFATTTPIPEDVDAVLYVSIKELTIDVQKDEAILTTTVDVSLRRESDQKDIYKKTVRYQDRDTLKHWTENDNALWQDYRNFARHYFGREISAEVIDRIDLQNELKPVKSATVETARKNVWQGKTRSIMPTLAWEFRLLGGDVYGSWADDVKVSDVLFDLEVYDMHRPVYVERNIQGSTHTLLAELDQCKTYRWSVRPSYRHGEEIRHGKWMRFVAAGETGDGNGSVGRQASAAPAYIQDFATLEIKCGRK